MATQLRSEVDSFRPAARGLWGWTERSNYEARCSVCPGCSRNFISGTHVTTAIGNKAVTSGSSSRGAPATIPSSMASPLGAGAERAYQSSSQSP